MKRIARFSVSILATLTTTFALAANPVLFVTQVPIPADFATIASVFGNHLPHMEEVGRGGDLYVRYPDGTLRNLTREAGFGVATELQGTNAIAVRDPSVHWSGTKAVFSMVVGGVEPADIYREPDALWQIYEVTGLARGEPVRIVKVPNQPQYNNVEPTYASDGDIIFASDRPRDGSPHLHPQVDEYENRRITTGLWRLDPRSSALTLLQHSPSGSFTPFVNRAGRVIYTRWDHLQTDQESDRAAPRTFNFASEAPGAPALADRTELFPAPRVAPLGSVYKDHRFNQMFAWQINQDGTEEETLEHIGRQELLGFFDRARNDDPRVIDFTYQSTPRENRNPIDFLLQLREHPTEDGVYFATDAREFENHASGQLVMLRTSALGADGMRIEYLTPRETWCCQDETNPLNTGHYRNPLMTTDGRLLASHTTYGGRARNLGSREFPDSPFDFRIKTLIKNGQYYEPAENLTGPSGIVRTVKYYDPDVLVTYTGPMWELSPVEVVARSVPPEVTSHVKAPEQRAFDDESVELEEFRAFLRDKNLGLIVVRDATRRDAGDKQQPYNLRVPGGVSTVSPSGGKVYDIAKLQFFQADLIRGATDRPGRRPLARHLNVGQFAQLNEFASDPPASVPIYPDGSAALLVPTRRALSWQSLSPTHAPVVQERYWVTLQPGEIRTCDGCHGVNTTDQAGNPAASNTALALKALLSRWKVAAGGLFKDGFE